MEGKKDKREVPNPRLDEISDSAKGLGNATTRGYYK